MYDGTKTSLNSMGGGIYNSEESKSYFHERPVSYKEVGNLQTTQCLRECS